MDVIDKNSQRICQLGRSVIETEIEMLKEMLDKIDTNFAFACQRLLKCKGRVIVMGMGKSGHIARKVAATFASTGTPSFFIHPGEAKHGDCGMITKDDVIVVISNSGETEEILSILPFIKRLQIDLIALTGRHNSSLAQIATVHLDISVRKEACPLGLAPTSSTTAALVMGDALAIALLENRGFTAEDFALSHPGGSLGKRLLLKVEDIMHSDLALPKVDFEVFLKTALMEMTQKKLGMTTIVNKNGELMGVFTDGDVRRAFDNAADIHTTKINAIMNPNPKTIKPNLLVAEALNMMEQYKITSLIVTDDINIPIGVIHLHDIVRSGII